LGNEDAGPALGPPPPPPLRLPAPPCSGRPPPLRYRYNDVSTLPDTARRSTLSQNGLILRENEATHSRGISKYLPAPKYIKKTSKNGIWGLGSWGLGFRVWGSPISPLRGLQSHPRSHLVVTKGAELHFRLGTEAWAAAQSAAVGAHVRRSLPPGKYCHSLAHDPR